MVKLEYELETPVAGFKPGQVLQVTAQYGDWHPYDVKLRPRDPSKGGSTELTWDELRAQSSLLEEPPSPEFAPR